MRQGTMVRVAIGRLARVVRAAVLGQCAMRVRCPKCRKKLNVADKYAGKGVRCPACRMAFRLPEAQAAVGGNDLDHDLDLEGLADVESQSSVLSRRELQHVMKEEEKAAQEDETRRICPNCQKTIIVQDPYAEVLCSHCWQTIPARIKGRSSEAVAPRRAGPSKAVAGFYAGLVSCLTYPLPAVGSLLTAALIAFAAGLVPAAVVTGGVKLMEQSRVGTAEGTGGGDLSGVTLLLLAIFSIEVVFFSAVALHAFLDVVRSTAIRTDRPPNLTWSPRDWGKSFFAYVAIAVYFAVAAYLVASVSATGSVSEYLLNGRFKEMLASGGTGMIVGLVIVSAVLPMALIGVSLTSITSGLNPVNILKSIGKTHGHYAFLLALLCVYGAMFGAAFSAILFDWFMPKFDAMVKSSTPGDLIEVALSLLAWGAVMGVFYYGTYVLARLHGLFARAFRKQLAFGMD